MSRFRFKGKDGSCGYRTGKVYFATLIYDSRRAVYFYPLNPFRMVVPYSSEDNFFDNWEVL